MFGALLGAGASLIGGLFGGGSKKQETTTTNYVDYKRLVHDSDEAGFNPLTALRNGGAAGFSVSTGTTPATPLSERLVNGITGAAQSFLTNFDPFADQQRDLGFRVAEAQLANLQADTRIKQVQLGGVPTYTAGTQKRVMGAGVKHGQTFKSAADVVPAPMSKIVDMPDLSGAISTVAGAAVPNLNPLASQPPETVRPERINPYPSWTGIERNPWTAGAEAAEDALGENFAVSLTNSVSELGHDAAWNLYRASRYLNNEYQKNSALTRKKMSKNKDSRRGWEIGRDAIRGLWNGNPPLSSPRMRKQ